MSVNVEGLVDIGSQTEVSKREAVKAEGRSRNIGSLATLKMNILDYVRSNRFTTGLARAGESPDFHAVSTHVDKEGNIDRISRKINIQVFGGTIVEVVTQHTPEEGLSRKGLEITKDNPRRFAEARRPLIQAGLEGKAVNDAVIYVSSPEKGAYSLNGNFMQGPSRAELVELTEAEQEQAANDILLVHVQDHLRAPQSVS